MASAGARVVRVGARRDRLNQGGRVCPPLKSLRNFFMRKMSAHQWAKSTGRYYADEEGRIFSNYGGKCKILKLKRQKYLRFNAYDGFGNTRTVIAHRFIWFCLIGDIPFDKEINHKNFDTRDNRISNLELLTRAENVRHAAQGGRLNKRKNQGEKNIRAKLSASKVLEIYRRRIAGESVTALKMEFNVGDTAIRDIQSKKSWRHLWES